MTDGSVVRHPSSYRTLLVIDPDRSVHETFAQTLAEVGYRIDTANQSDAVVGERAALFGRGGRLATARIGTVFPHARRRNQYRRRRPDPARWAQIPGARPGASGPRARAA
jgi:hypothetical protein